MPCRSDRTVTIDLAALRTDGVIGPDNEERRLAEEYRIVKRPLLKSMSGEDAQKLSNIIVVTSAVPGEGKTFTSINLALSLARRAQSRSRPDRRRRGETAHHAPVGAR